MKKFFPDIEVVKPTKHVDNRGEIWTNYEKSMFINNATINHTKYSTSK